MTGFGPRAKALLCFLSLLATPGCSSLIGLGRAGGQGTGGSLAVSLSSLNFGTVVVGGSQVLSENVSNPSSSSVTINGISVNNSAFQVIGPKFPLALAPGQQAELKVSFTPRSSGSPAAMLSISTTAATSATVTLTGTAVPPGHLRANPPSISFGTVTVGSSETDAETFINTGSSNVTISQVSVTGSGIQVGGLNLPLTLAPNQSTAFSVTFTPKTTGNASGSISVSSSVSLAANARVHPALLVLSSYHPNDSSTQDVVTIPVSGSGMAPGQLGANYTIIPLGSVAVGSTQSQTVTLANSGGSDVNLSQALLSGAGYSISGLSLPLILPAGQSLPFAVSFTPRSLGSASGSIQLISDAADSTLTLTLSATGVASGNVGAKPASLTFGNVRVGASQTLNSILTNPGGSSVTITQAAISGAGFSFSGLSLPLTLAANQSTTISIVFTAQAAGSVSGNLVIDTNGSNASLSLPLSGTGVGPGTLAASPISINFGSVQLGNVKTLQDTLNNSGGSPITITQTAAAGSGFTVSGASLPLILLPGHSTTLSVSFAATSAGQSSGTLVITSTASNSPLTIPLSGSGATQGVLSASTPSLIFGSIQVGGSSEQTETITNSGGTSLTVSQATVSGLGFSVSGLTLPMTLNAGQSFTFGMTFAPQSSGNTAGTLTLFSNASNSSLAVSLSGTGVASGQLAINPASIDLGAVAVGSSKTATASLNASGASVTVSSASLSSTEFTITGLSLPLTVSAGQSALFTVTFTPQAGGVASGSITFGSDASNSPAVLALSGTGSAPPQHSVSLSWNASTGVITGYNVYRGVTSGGPYNAQMNSSIVSDTSFIDQQVTSGQTYYYVTRAVSNDGTESGNSNEAGAKIPTP